jgi:hypothetical protein
MKTPLPVRFLFTLGLIALGLTVLRGQPLVYETVYRNTSDIYLTNGLPGIYRFGVEHGDDIELAGTARRVTQFTFRYFCEPLIPTGKTLKFRLYQNDGSRAVPSAVTSQRPSTLIWESEEMALQSGDRVVTLALPEVEVPDRFTWTVQFKGIDTAVGKGAGLVIAPKPTIGRKLPVAAGQPATVERVGSYWDFWLYQVITGGWRLMSFGVGENDPKANFYAEVIAARVAPPEPTLTITPAATVGGPVTLTWPAAYQLQRRSTLAGADWANVTATPPLEVPAEGDAAFFRVVVP